MTDKLPGKRAFPRLLEPPGGLAESSQRVRRGTTNMKMQPSVYTRPIFSKYFSTQPIKNCAGSPFCDELKV